MSFGGSRLGQSTNSGKSKQDIRSVRTLGLIVLPKLRLSRRL